MLSSIKSDRLQRVATIVRHCRQAARWLLPVLILSACSRPAEYGYAPGGGYPPAGIGGAPTRYYPPPGPPGDPWGPYIRVAASRYQVPEQWVRAVMHQESDGQEQAVSPAGAMGLMQIMPATYEGLRERYGLGDDPFEPQNNILAGTAYIREMYDRFGAPGFLAAYNAGPERVEGYLNGSSDLPDETVNYLAVITPNLGTQVAMSGPLASYASARSGVAIGTAPGVTNLAAGCDLNAAYDPNHPCTSLIQAATAPARVAPAMATQFGANGCDLSAAYDPSHPCTSVGQAVAVAAAAAPPLAVAAAAPPVTMAAAASPPPSRQAALQQTPAGCDLDAAYDPNHPCKPAPQPSPMVRLASAEGCDPKAAYDPNRPCSGASVNAGAATAAAVAPAPAAASYTRYRPPPSNRPMQYAALGGPGEHVLAIPNRDWAIQVGAFANPALARAVAEGARAQAPIQLRAATLTFPPTPYGSSVLYRARLAHLSATAAADACMELNQRQLPCIVVQPSRS